MLKNADNLGFFHSCSGGVVGYHASLTHWRSRVRFSARIRLFMSTRGNQLSFCYQSHYSTDRVEKGPKCSNTGKKRRAANGRGISPSVRRAYTKCGYLSSEFWLRYFNLDAACLHGILMPLIYAVGASYYMGATSNSSCGHLWIHHPFLSNTGIGANDSTSSLVGGNFCHVGHGHPP
jgi:hypothetical protein